MSAPFSVGNQSVIKELLAKHGLETDPHDDWLQNITFVTAVNGYVMGRLKRAIAKLIPRNLKPGETNSFQALIPPMV